MLCIISDFTDPYFNLASEEYLLKQFTEDFFMLWRSDPSIVVGKNQNVLAEFNQDYIRNKGIKVVRRLSGGGTVYHDLGNLNFAFIMNKQGEHIVDYKQYTQPILKVLKMLSVDAMFEGKNDLTIKGKKFSGNAVYVYRNRMLHHGTLLFSSSLDQLLGALKVEQDKYTSMAVESKRSEVTNIREHLKEDIDVLEFRDMILHHVLEIFPGAEMYEFTIEDIINIKKLRDEKYNTWLWNYGYSPKYELSKSFMINGRSCDLCLVVSRGKIQKAKIVSDHIPGALLKGIEEGLPGIPHIEDHILKKLKELKLFDHFQGVTAEEFVRQLF